MEYQEKDGLLYPQLAVAAPEDDKPLTKYGTMYKKYLKEEHPGRYAILLQNLELMAVCHRVEREANEYEDNLLPQLRKEHPAPKTDDFMETVQYNNWLYKTAEEMTLENVVYPSR
ncbi:TnpV protein [Caproiciproducens faecalis]|uniref:TnpV protein n=1 Tax=Caproiciproducens faecalis TaxID=2820301 RepID=A0ABS7DPD3_9FIRM|nr:TnpV protein [Caproiciproducens faecalis]MBW7573172.1 TnpV protein [Caproiciproducens faecalis]